MALGALLAIGCALAAVVVLTDRHPGRGRAGGVPAGETTATVTRRTLTESSTVDGTLGYGATSELYDRLSGTFTWLPSVGATIVRGGTLFRVNNLAVVLMYGSLPAYRNLKEGVSDGPDVAELNRNLTELGYDPYDAITDDAHFGAATAVAVRRWQKAEGLPESGEVELGRVIFAPNARRVTSLHVALGQDPPGGEAPSAPTSPQAPADRQPPSKRPPSPSRDKPPAGRHVKRKPRHPAAAPAQHSPAGEHDKDSPDDDKGSPDGEQGSDPSQPEGGSGAGTAVLTTTSTQQLVQLKLKAEQQQLARVGELAPVTLPGGEVVQGRIIEVGTVASEAKGGEGEKGSGGNGGSPGAEASSESATIPVTLALTHRVARLDQAPVSVDLVKSVRVNVLAVPATALIATAAGGYAIEVREGAGRVQLPVTPGMFADGYVQVQGSGLYEGQTVFESE